MNEQPVAVNLHRSIFIPIAWNRSAVIWNDITNKISLRKKGQQFPIDFMIGTVKTNYKGVHAFRSGRCLISAE